MLMRLKYSVLAFVAALMVLACRRTAAPEPGTETLTYALGNAATASFAALPGGGVQVKISTASVQAGTVAALYYGPLNEQQGRAALLGSVNTTGETIFTITALENGLPFGLADLQNFDGCLRLYTTNPNTPTAGADVGGNALTGDATPYSLLPQNNSGVSGTFTIYKRRNGLSRVDVVLTGTQAGALHPLHIHLGGPSVCGTIAVTLQSVVGATGTSSSTLRAYDSQSIPNAGAPLSYMDLLGLSKCLKVHTSSANDAEIATN